MVPLDLRLVRFTASLLRPLPNTNAVLIKTSLIQGDVNTYVQYLAL